MKLNRREFTYALTGAGALLSDLKTASGSGDVPAYRNPKLTIEQRVADLLGRMTLEEKVEQISGGFHYAGVVDPTGRYTDENYREALANLHEPGNINVTVSARDRAVLRNALQRYMVEKTPLGIPALFIGEGLHGFMENGSTSFPQAIGLASTWDPELLQQVFTVVADEASAVGVKQIFAPVVHVGRDPR